MQSVAVNHQTSIFNKLSSNVSNNTLTVNYENSSFFFCVCEKIHFEEEQTIKISGSSVFFCVLCWKKNCLWKFVIDPINIDKYLSIYIYIDI